jgi:dihydroorotate dehydrogenase (fumarate)
MNLKTKYLGLELENPIVPSASPLTRDLDTIKALEDAGASAVVLYSLFEEELDMNEEAMQFFNELGTESFSEALDYFPKDGKYASGMDEYVDHLAKVKETVGIPVIASLNGASPGGWTHYAKLLEEAGADALEMNVYFLPTDPLTEGKEVEENCIEIVREVAESVGLPISVKLSPYFSSIPNMAVKLSKVGAKGLVLFNRFYQPDIDLEKLEVTPNLTLSSSWEARLAMRWVAILRGHVKVSLAATTGIHTVEDVVKMLMVGADVTQICSVLLKQGPQALTNLLSELVKWAEEHEYESVEQMRGSMSYGSVPFPALYERANYMKVLRSWEPAS